MRLMVLGFDALDYGLFRTRAPEGYTVLPLYSPVPVTGPAWTSIYTGKTLEHHGVRDVWGRPRSLPGYGMSQSYADQYCFWDALHAARKSVGLFGLPACHPPQEMNGWHVAGCGSGPDNFFWPGDLPIQAAANCDDLWAATDLIHNFGTYPDFPDWPGDFKDLAQNHALESAKWDAERCVKVASHIGLDKPVDALFLCFTFVDRFLHERDWATEYEQAYLLARGLIALAERTFRPQTTIIVSDHGGANGMHTDMGVFAYKGEGLRPLPMSEHGPTYGEPLCLPNPTDASEDVERPWLMKVAVGPQLAKPWTQDVAPTICALMGAKMNHADGRPIREILIAEDADEKAQKEHLYRLGYKDD